MPPKTIPIYQFKITLNETRPAVWRRFVVSANATLDELHEIIQIIMGWQNYHLHMFTLANQIYGNPADDEMGDLGTLDETDFRLQKLLTHEGQQFDYEYDFGDSWHHTLLLEKILPPGTYKHLPLCLEGQRACPPEDVGGTFGFKEFLDIIRNPRHKEYDSYQTWAGGNYDPRRFDPDTVNQRLRQAKRDAADVWSNRTASPDETPAIPEPSHWAGLSDEMFTPSIENLPLRRDALTLLAYLQANRVTGTQSTGNFPLKAVREISAQFVHPPALEDKIGEKIYPIRSEADVWQMVFIHHLSLAAGLISGGPGQRWTVTGAGEKFIAASPAVQVWRLFLGWWMRGNWGIAYAYAPADFPTPRIRQLTGEHLCHLPLGRPFPFELFADQLVQAMGFYWSQGDAEHQRRMSHHIVEYTILKPLANFGLLIFEDRPHSILGRGYRELDSLILTELGKSLLEAVKN